MRHAGASIALLVAASVSGACGGSSAQQQQTIDEEQLAQRVADIVMERLKLQREAEAERAAAAAEVAMEAVAIAGADVERFRVDDDGDRPRRGAAEPLVTIVAFSDFQCPFCARAVPTLERLLEAHPDTVRLVFRNNPLPMHRDAPLAHQAALEAYEQGGDPKFWQMHDLLFENQRALSRADLEGYARRIGLDLAAFRHALDTTAHGALVERDQAIARRVGARGTPHFFINGRRLPGAQPYDRFEEIVVDEIGRALEMLESGVPRRGIYAAFMDGAEEHRQADPSPSPTARPRPDPDAVYRVPVDDDLPQLGPDDALVTVVEIADFQCPFCSRVQGTVDRLRDRYGNDVRIVWMNNPLPFHQQAMPAAEAALEVQAQAGDEAFWDYRETLFANQRELTRENLERWADAIRGVNMRRFRRALDDHRHQDTIHAQQELVRELGATGTPSFFINGRNLRGAQPLEAFTAVVDEELARARAALEEGTPRRRLYEALVEDGATEPQVIGGD